MTIEPDRRLATWACQNSAARRPHVLQDEIHGDAMRTPFARDRDRIAYSRAFRRLAHKTQVYLTSEANLSANEHCRTRLTHSLEVSQIAKTIGKHLRLNEDLIEAIAFAHDVGHAPFGHAGEIELDRFLNGRVSLPKATTRLLDEDKRDEIFQAEYARDFRHNFQSVRLLIFLERYDGHIPDAGLNLTYQCLEGALKHTGTKSRFRPNQSCKYPESRFASFQALLNSTNTPPTVESVVVAIADEIAQIIHDLGDAIELGVVEIEDLKERQPSIQKALNFAQDRGKEVEMQEISSRNLQTNNTRISSALFEYFIRKTSEHLGALLGEASQDAGLADILGEIPVIPAPEDDFLRLKEFKDDLIVNNYNVNRMDNKGRYIIRSLTDAYISDPRQLPDSVLRRYMHVKNIEIHDNSRDYMRNWLAEVEDKCGSPRF